jgi:alpha-tubulin suppressor-like RCC1 family protein
MSKEIDIYYQKFYKNYKKNICLKNQHAGAGKIYFIIKIKESNKDNFKIFSNYNSTFIVKNNKIYASGKNDSGQLGLGDNEVRKTFTEVPPLPDNKVAKKVVVAGFFHTMILAEDGTVLACGWNHRGQFGMGDTTNRNTFTAVPALPDGKVVKQLVGGWCHTMILAEDGTVFACGWNVFGQLGLGDYTDRNTFTAVPALPDGKVAKQVVAGGHYTMILAEDGTVFVCGWNGNGQLGLGDTMSRNTFTAVPNLPVAKRLSAGGEHTMILAENGTILACGLNFDGQLGLRDKKIINTFTFTILPPLPDGKVAKQVVAGLNHTMILAEDGTVFGCGWNYIGQLGLGDDNYRNTFTAVPPLPDGKIAKQVIAGSEHTIIITEDNTVFGCGRNEDGQLGQGDKLKFYNFEQIKINIYQ